MINSIAWYNPNGIKWNLIFGTKFSSIYLAKGEKCLFFRLSFVNHNISNDRAAVKGVTCQPSAASVVDRRAAGDLRYRLWLDHLGLCKPAMRSWNQFGDWQGASVVRPVLVWYGWIYAVWGPPEQHSSEFAEYDSIVYLGCRYRLLQ